MVRSVHAGGTLHDLHGRLEARRPELEHTAMAKISAIGDRNSDPDRAYVAGLRFALEAAMSYGLAAIAAPTRAPDPVPVELLSQARLSARNGVSLDAVLRRYSAGHTLLSDVLLEEAAALGLGASELRTTLRALAARYELIVAAVSEEYEREATAEPQGTDRRRYALLRRLLAGEHLDSSSLGYELDAHHLAIVATGEQAAGALTALGERLDRRPLIAEPEAELAWAWFGGRREFSPEELDLIASHPWPSSCALAIGEAAEGVSGWRLSHRQAAAALPVAQRSPERCVHYPQVALLVATLGDDLLSTSLRRAYLAPLESQRDKGVAAKATLRAYFNAARNSSSAGAALGVSRRTVAARLGAVEELLERPLEQISSELEVALRMDELGRAGADALA